MPPIPEIGAGASKQPEQSNLFTKPPGPSTQQPTATGNIFASALQKSGVSKNPFGGGGQLSSTATAPPRAVFGVNLNPPAPPTESSTPATSSAPRLKRPTLDEKPDLFKTVPTSSNPFASSGGKTESSSSTAPKNPFFAKLPQDQPKPGGAGNIFATKPPASQKEGANIFAMPKSDSSAVAPGNLIFGQPASKPPSSSSGSGATAKSPFEAASLFSKPPPPIAKPAGGGIKSRLGAIPNVVQDASEKEETTKRLSDDFSGSEEGSSVDGSVSDGKTLQRLTSKEELKAIKSIVCEQIPAAAMNKKVLEKHFSKFGEVKRVFISKKGTATVHFADHKAAKKAKDKGHAISPRIPSIGAIFYSRTRKSSEMEPPPSVSKVGDHGDVDDELSAMAGGDFSSPFSATPPEAPRKRKLAVPNLLAEKVPASEPPGTGIFGQQSKEKKQKPAIPLKRRTATKEATPPPPASSNIVTAGGGDETSSIKPKLSIRELMAVMQSQAMNEQDRFEILDARDKYIREKFAATLGKGTTLKGVCPDICPEKERYSRAVKNQLRIYEKVHGGLDHKAVIKEYSRSSADQDIPLPHEMRPSRVLSTAFDFLMCNVIDRIDSMDGTMAEWFEYVMAGSVGDFIPTQEGDGNENTGEWFEYVWSATRAIR